MKYQWSDSTASEHIDDYIRCFESNDPLRNSSKTPLDPIPRIALVPGVRLFALGKSMKEANVAADFHALSVDGTLDAERIGPLQARPIHHLFDVEYWSLEQDKLGKSNLRVLDVRVEGVANAFLDHACALKITADETTIEGGNINAKLR